MELSPHNSYIPKKWSDLFSGGKNNPVESQYSPKGTQKIQSGGTYVGGLFYGCTFKSMKSGGRVEMFPTSEIGIVCYDDNGEEVFKTFVDGESVGDVILGDFSTSKYVMWDKSTAQLIINGITLSDFVATSIATGSDLSLQDWTSTLAFSATDSNTVAWAAGDLRFSTGTVYSITGGNTGNISALTYIYFDKAVSVTVLQTTTTAASAIGANKVLIAVASPNTDTARKATYQVYDGTGGINLSVANLAGNDASTNEFLTNSSQIKDNTVTFAKMQNIATARILGRTTAEAGDIEELTAGAGISLSGGQIACTITQVSQYTDEMAQDTCLGNIVAGTGLTGAYDDEAGHYDISCTITQYTDGMARNAVYPSVPIITSGTAAPATTPGKVGDLFVDTNNKKIYVATGNSSSADWTLLN